MELGTILEKGRIKMNKLLTRSVEQHRQRRATRKATGPHPTFLQGRYQGPLRHAEARLVHILPINPKSLHRSITASTRSSHRGEALSLRKSNTSVSPLLDQFRPATQGRMAGVPSRAGWSEEDTHLITTHTLLPAWTRC